MQTHRCLSFTLSLCLAACGVGSEQDPQGIRDDRLNGSVPVSACEGSSEQACLDQPQQCEAVYSGGICPLLACPQDLSGGSSCPPCPPRTFVECRTRCELLDEVSCNARTDCTAQYALEVCPLSACQDPTQCPECKPRFTGCSSGGSGGGVISADGGTATSPPGVSGGGSP
jgi:hypothetical protein